MITPETVLKLKKPPEKFLCPLNANKYSIDFVAFTISDYSSKQVFFHIDKDAGHVSEVTCAKALDEDSLRTIHYKLSADILKTDTVATKLIFSIGNKPLKRFRLIERHYFKDKLIKTYDFKFGFCIPNTTNTWEAIYSVPLLESSLIKEMIRHPKETVSDSFYFVDEELVIHNRAKYTYIQPRKKSRLGQEQKEEKESKICESKT